MVYLLLAAGGSGSRMKSALPKQFIHIGGKPLFIKTLEVFRPFCAHIVIGMNKEYISLTKDMIKDFLADASGISIIEGGRSRMETMRSTYRFLENKFSLNDSIILTHDAARPFVPASVIENNITAASLFGACGTFLSVTDTMAFSENGEELDAVPDRTRLYSVQTPQTFRADILKKLLSKPLEEIDKFTDMCGLAKEFGVTVRMVEGCSENIKITTKSDLYFAEALTNKQ